MKEVLLQYAWQHKLYYTGNLVTTNGNTVEVINPGLLNSDAGPDFFNAKLKIGNTLWAGNVEIHVKSSDWNAHHHADNAGYNNIILHVIAYHDIDLQRANGEPIEQLVIPIYADLEEKYEQLIAKQLFIPCAPKLAQVPRIVLSSWKNALLMEKLEAKVGDIHALLAQTQYNWEETFYIVLARNFGLGINAIPFEMMAKSLPQIYLAKHKDNLFQVEAMLFGQSGLLASAKSDEYTDRLKKEYAFLQTKYHLHPIDGHLWKLLRLRPQNFPHIRIAQLANLAITSSKLFSKILDTKTLTELEALFHCQVSEYWQSHYTFNKLSSRKNKPMGISTIRILLINTVIPFLFAYGQYKDDAALQEQAISLLEQMPAEHNSIVEHWAKYNIKAMSAYDSQALIFLKKHYCDEKKCLHCRIGHFILSEPS